MGLIATGSVAVGVHVIIDLALCFGPALGSNPPGRSRATASAPAATLKGVLPGLTAGAHGQFWDMDSSSLRKWRERWEKNWEGHSHGSKGKTSENEQDVPVKQDPAWACVSCEKDSVSVVQVSGNA